MLIKNFTKSKDDDFARAIYDYLDFPGTLPSRLIISLEYFGAKRDIIKDFIDDLSEEAIICLDYYSKVRANDLRNNIGNIHNFLDKYEEEIKTTLLNNQDPNYQILAFLLVYFLIRLGLKGLLYWTKFKKYPSLAKLVILLLKMKCHTLRHFLN